MPFHSTPTEILLCVFHLAYHGHSRLTAAEPDKTTLGACALVSSKWTGAAQSILLGRISLSASKSRSIYAAMSSSGRPSAFTLDQTRENALSLAPAMRFARTLEIIGAVPDWDHFVALVRLFPVASNLTLTAWSLTTLPWTVSDHGLHHIESSTAPDLRCSSVNSLSVNVTTVYLPLAHLLSIFPQLSALTIGGLPQSIGILTHPPPNIELHELHIHSPFWAGERQDEIIPWILHGAAAKKSLEILSLADMPQSSSFARLIADHAPFLRSLRLPRLRLEHSDPAAAHIRLISACGMLEELVLPFLPSAPLLAVLPPTLQHFAFKNDFATRRVFDMHTKNTIEPVIQCLRTAETSLPALRLVSYTAETYATHEECETLKSVCRQKGIGLRVYTNPLGTLKGEVSCFYLVTGTTSH